MAEVRTSSADPSSSLFLRKYARTYGRSATQVFQPASPEAPSARRAEWTGFPLPRAEGRLVLNAHRGASALAMENTRSAFDKGYADGADAAETDVEFTRDGVPVLFHDDTTGRIAANGVDVRISETLWSDLQRLELKGGAQILTLEELLRDFKDRYPGWKLNLEIKSELGAQPEQTWRKTAGQCREKGARVAQILADYPELWPLVNVSSFNPHVLRGIRDVNQQIPSALLHSPDCDFMYRGRSVPEMANAVGAQGINVHFSSVLNGQCDPQALSKLGFPVSCYTVDDPAAAKVLLEKGCAGIFTNDPASMGARPRRPLPRL